MRTRFAAIAVIATFSTLVLTGCTFAQVPQPRPSSTPAPSTSATSQPAAGPITTQFGLVYRHIDGQDLGVDACLPKDADHPVPAVVVIHGGGFRKGDGDSAQTRAVCEWLAGAGFAAFSIDYRLAPQHPFPAAVEDTHAFVEWLRDPAQVARFDIDPARIGAIGGSAGGNLAAELGTAGSGSWTTGSRVAATVSLSGPMDLGSDALTLGTPPEDRKEVARIYLNCPDLTACPAGTEASPFHQLDKSDPPMLIAHSEDERIPVQQATAMITAAEADGVSVTPWIVPGSRHAWSLLDDQLKPVVLDFLHTNLGS